MDNSSSNQPIYLSEEEGLDVKKYIFLILGHWWWFAISVFVALSIAYMINRYSQEIYSDSCSVIVGEEQSGSGNIEDILDELSKVRNRRRKAVVEDEMSVLKSYKLARMALEELDFGVTYVAVGRRGIAETHLYKNSPFVVEYTKNDPRNYPVNILMLSDKKYRLTIDDNFHIDTIADFGDRVVVNPFDFVIRLRNPEHFDYKKEQVKKFYFIINNINSLANQYRSALSVTVNDQKGTILTLSMKGYVREQLADYLNKLSEVYLRSNLEEKNKTSDNTIKFIDEQLGGIVDSLEATGLRLQKFRTANKVIDLSEEGTFLFQKMQDLQSEKAIYDIKANYFKYLLTYIEKKDVLTDVVAPSVVGIDDELLNSLVQELNELIQKHREISFSVSADAPQIGILDAQIENAKKSLQENLKSLVESNKLALDNVDNRIGTINKEVEKLPATEKQMIDIQRKFTINDQIYTFLLQKRAESGITKASNTSDHKILDIARPENAVMVKPKVTMNYMIALILGAGIPLLLLLIMEFFNTKITDRHYLESRLRVPIIGNIGHNEGNTDLPVTEKPGASLTESFRALRTNLQYLLQEKQKGIIAVTSAISGEGKTFNSVNLAAIIAMTGKKTLLISLDLRRPKIHRIFNLENKTGMSTYLIGNTEYQNIIKESNVANLYITVSGPVPPNPAELLGSDKMIGFLERAKKQFDYIIIDTPPAAVVTDALVLKNLFDILVFVLRHNYSDKQVVEMLNGLYDKHLIRNIGVVINDIQLTGYYGYSYRYGYGYGYSYSYGYKARYYEDEQEDENLIKQVKKRFRF